MSIKFLNQNIFECLKFIERKFDQVKTIADNVYNCLIEPSEAISEIDSVMTEICDYMRFNMAYPYLEFYLEDIKNRVIEIRENIKIFKK
jgi:hypothetical protein